METRNENIEPCKARILKAIKNGNNEPKYIVERVTGGSLDNLKYGFVMGQAFRELVIEGKIKYNENLEGYYLA